MYFFSCRAEHHPRPRAARPRRLELNKKSAQESRKRKRERLEELQKSVDKLEHENEELRKANHLLRQMITPEINPMSPHALGAQALIGMHESLGQPPSNELTALRLGHPSLAGRHLGQAYRPERPGGWHPGHGGGGGGGVGGVDVGRRRMMMMEGVDGHHGMHRGAGMHPMGVGPMNGHGGHMYPGPDQGAPDGRPMGMHHAGMGSPDSGPADLASRAVSHSQMGGGYHPPPGLYHRMPPGYHHQHPGPHPGQMQPPHYPQPHDSAPEYRHPPLPGAELLDTSAPAQAGSPGTDM